MFNLTATLATPAVTDDEDFVYPLELSDKKELHKVESALIRALRHLDQLTERELETGVKPFAGTDPQLVTFTVDIVKDGADYGGYAFRWPNQTVEARDYLRGLLDGIMRETGHQNAKQRVKKEKKEKK